MAHKKAAGSTRLGRDSRAQRLGVKIFGDQWALAGNIIIRQRGSKFTAGEGVGIGKDDTLFALYDGIVKFKRIMRRKFTGTLRPTRVVSIEPRTYVYADAPVAPAPVVDAPVAKPKKAATKKVAQ